MDLFTILRLRMIKHQESTEQDTTTDTRSVPTPDLKSTPSGETIYWTQSQTIPSDTRTYSMSLSCINCGSRSIRLYIKCGVLRQTVREQTEVYKDIPCEYCGCTNVLEEVN